MLYNFLKRTLDLSVSLAILVLFFPVFLIIGTWIKLDSQGPVFFLQERAGKKGASFLIYKFRTMRSDPDSEQRRGVVLDNDDRITKAGRFLRKTSLDELPQLINVLKGDMSLVGPRPTLPYQLQRYTPRQRQRLDVLPGITGWAQVNGRTKLSWNERIELDLWYGEHRSFRLDLKILLKTFLVVFRAENVHLGSPPAKKT
jgi:lipopolysaccharide/colanic/teichoic acid biosynthesis glycosyltransferase